MQETKHSGIVRRKKWTVAATAMAGALTLSSAAWACTFRMGQTVTDRPAGFAGTTVAVGAVAAPDGPGYMLNYVPPANLSDCGVSTAFVVNEIGPQYASPTTGIIENVEVPIPTWLPEDGMSRGIMRFCWATDGASIVTVEAPFLVL